MKVEIAFLAANLPVPFFCALRKPTCSFKGFHVRPWACSLFTTSKQFRRTDNCQRVQSKRPYAILLPTIFTVTTINFQTAIKNQKRHKLFENIQFMFAVSHRMEVSEERVVHSLRRARRRDSIDGSFELCINDCLFNRSCLHQDAELQL